jgi:hypothetical protein
VTWPSCAPPGAYSDFTACCHGKAQRAWAYCGLHLSGDAAGGDSYLVISAVDSQGDEKALAISAKSEHGRCDVCAYLRAFLCQARFTGFDAVCQM